MKLPTSEQLDEWLEASKTPEGRERLVDGGQAATAARALLRCSVAW